MIRDTGWRTLRKPPPSTNDSPVESLDLEFPDPAPVIQISYHEGRLPACVVNCEYNLVRRFGCDVQSVEMYSLPYAQVLQAEGAW